MDRRKFRPDRLYKIIRAIVIVIGACIFIMGAYSLYYFTGGPGSYEKTLEKATKMCNTQIGHGRLYEKDITPNCVGRELGNRNYEVVTSYKIIALGALIPIMFFIGERLFNYVYPKKE